VKLSTISNQIAITWNKLPLILRAVLTGFIVSSIGIATWSIMISSIAAPWSILPMIIALWAYLKFFSGSWSSKKSSVTKKNHFRSIKLTPSIWKWSIAAAILFVIIVQASFVITFRLIDFPAEKFTADYKILDNMRLLVALAVIIMSSIVAGICEETGFRGYMQAPLEKKYSPFAGIIITSIIFMLIHLSHSWASPILPHIFFASVLLGILAYKSGSLIPGIIGHSILDIFDYSFWWSDIAGGFHRQTIFKTGIDFHFIVWSVIFILTFFMFFRSIDRLKKETGVLADPVDEMRLNY